jgi:hypothetical protein
MQVKEGSKIYHTSRRNGIKYGFFVHDDTTKHDYYESWKIEE